MTETETSNKNNTGEPSEMFYEINRLRDRVNNEVKEHAEEIEKVKRQVIEKALESIQEKEEEAKSILEKDHLKELKTIEEKIDLIIEGWEIEQNEGKPLLKIIRSKFRRKKSNE